MLKYMPDKNAYEIPDFRVIGKASEKTKKWARDRVVSNLYEGHFLNMPSEAMAAFKNIESIKTNSDKEAIRLANLKLGGLQKKLGVPAWEIPERNIHLAPGPLFEKYVPDKNITGQTWIIPQLIIINEGATGCRAELCEHYLHEMTHLKGYFSAETDEENKIYTYRMGLKVYTTKQKSEVVGNYWSFEGLDEAVVTEIEKRLLKGVLEENKYMENELLGQNSDGVQKIKGGLASARKISEEEIYFVDELQGSCYRYPYPRQRAALEFMVKKIYEKFEDQFSSPEEIYMLFFKAFFTGDIVTIARLITKTFGKDSMRIIGMMTKEPTSANMLLDYLRKK